jgi:hypothetical protein
VIRRLLVCTCSLLLTCVLMLTVLLCRTEEIREQERERMAKTLREQFWEPIAAELRAMAE